VPLLKAFIWIQDSLFQEKSVLPFCNRTGLKPASDLIRGFLIGLFISFSLLWRVSLLKDVHWRMAENCP